jgi:hypothetical protein
MEGYMAPRKLQENSFPCMFAAVNKRVANTRLVVEALTDDRWIRDISGSLSIPVLHQYMQLWSQLQVVQLASTIDDKFIWKWSANQQYSSFFGL